MSVSYILLAFLLFSSYSCLKIWEELDPNLENTVKPEVRSALNALSFILGNLTGMVGGNMPKTSMLRDVILELLDSEEPILCDREKEDYESIRGKLAEQLLNQNIGNYKDFSVVSKDKDSSFLYQALLDPTAPQAPSIVENQISPIHRFEDHKLRNFCLDEAKGASVDAVFLSHFKSVLFPYMPSKVQQLFNMVLNQKHKFKKIYKTMKFLADNQVEDPDINLVRENITKSSITIMKELWTNSSINYNIYKDSLVEMLLTPIKFNKQIIMKNNTEYVKDIPENIAFRRILYTPFLTPVLPAGSDAKYKYFQNFIQQVRNNNQKKGYY